MMTTTPQYPLHTESTPYILRIAAQLAGVRKARSYQQDTLEAHQLAGKISVLAHVTCGQRIPELLASKILINLVCRANNSGQLDMFLANSDKGCAAFPKPPRCYCGVNVRGPMTPRATASNDVCGK